MREGGKEERKGEEGKEGGRKGKMVQKSRDNFGVHTHISTLTLFVKMQS